MKIAKLITGIVVFLLFAGAGEEQKKEEGLWDPQAEVENKAVPAISAGDGVRIGMMVVSGVKEQVEKVKAVAVLEGDFKDVARYRILIPVSMEDVLKNINRVPHTAVTGVVDIKISRDTGVKRGFPAFFLKIRLGEIAGGAAIYLLVKEYGEAINKAINEVLLNKKMEVKMATRVVPIVSGGKGLFVGAAQVTGAKSLVEQVKAVAQIETTLGKVRAKGLVPIRAMKFDKDALVKGVGVSALIDARLTKLF